MSRWYTTALGALVAIPLVLAGCNLSDPPRKRSASEAQKTAEENSPIEATPQGDASAEPTPAAQADQAAPKPKKSRYPMTSDPTNARSRLGGKLARPQLRMQTARPRLQGLRPSGLQPVGRPGMVAGPTVGTGAVVAEPVPGEATAVPEPAKPQTEPAVAPSSPDESTAPAPTSAPAAPVPAE